MNISQIDHVALHVADVETSKQFYVDVLELEQLPRPAFDFPGAWFALGTQELHLIGDRKDDVNSHHRGTHFAVSVSDVDPVAKRLKDCGLDFILKHRPDGARQVFVQDPDGHYMEFCQPPQNA